jgi:hypothetical protein
LIKSKEVTDKDSIRSVSAVKSNVMPGSKVHKAKATPGIIKLCWSSGKAAGLPKEDLDKFQFS